MKTPDQIINDLPDEIDGEETYSRAEMIKAMTAYADQFKSPDADGCTDEQFEKELERRWPDEKIILNAYWIDYNNEAIAFADWLKSELLKGGKG